MPKYCENCKEMTYRKGTKYNHAFSLSFSVDSIFENEEACLKHESGEVISRLMERISDIVRDGILDSEAFECSDTFEIEEVKNG